MKKRFTEERIIAVLKEAEAGAKVGELNCKRNTGLILKLSIVRRVYPSWNRQCQRH